MTASASDLKNLRGIIYLIRNDLTQEIYIGKTERTFCKRYGGGKWWKRTDNVVLRQAAEYHGHENFSVEILEHGLDTNKLIEREIFYIDTYQCIHPMGYNRVRNSSRGMSGACEETRQCISRAQKTLWASKTEDERKRGPMAKETKEILRQQRLGTKATDETRQKMSEARAGVKHPQYGRSAMLGKGFTHSSQTRHKIGIATKARGRGNNCNLVVLLDNQTGELLQEFASPETAASQLGLNVENVYSCCRHKKGQMTAGGYRLDYKIGPKPVRKCPVLQLDKDTLQILSEFPSPSAAAKHVGVKMVNNLRMACNGKRLTCGGYRWKYKT